MKFLTPFLTNKIILPLNPELNLKVAFLHISSIYFSNYLGYISISIRFLHIMGLSSLIKTTKIIYWAIVTGIILFAIVTYFLVDRNGAYINDPSLVKTIIYIIIGFILIFHFMANIIYRKSLERIDRKDPLPARLKIYQKSLLLKTGLLEAEALLILVLVLLTGELLFFLLMLFILFMLFHTRNKPTMNNIARDLNLTEKEIQTIRESDIQEKL